MVINCLFLSVDVLLQNCHVFFFLMYRYVRDKFPPGGQQSLSRILKFFSILRQCCRVAQLLSFYFCFVVVVVFPSPYCGLVF